MTTSGGWKGGTTLAVLVSAVTLASPPAAFAQEDGSAPPPAPVYISPAPPVVILSYYQTEDLPKLVKAVRKAGVPAGTPLYFGTYAGGGDPSGLLKRPTKVLKGPPGGRRAPIFPLQPSAFWAKRQVSKSDSRRAGRSYSGRIPNTRRLLAGPAARRIAWGRELGRRFRDRLRVLRRVGLPTTTWQFDEIFPSAAGPRGQRVRELTRGVLDGLYLGRPKLGDRPQQGIVFISRGAFPLTNAPLTPELAAFWSTVDRSALRLVGEEYIPFNGDPAQVAALFADGQRSLAQAADVRAPLARRYVVGMTPGARRGRSLSGNSGGRSRAEVNAFRDAYVRQRAMIGVAGFGQFNFIRQNSRQSVIDDAIRAIVEGLRAAATRGATPPAA